MVFIGEIGGFIDTRHPSRQVARDTSTSRAAGFARPHWGHFRFSLHPFCHPRNTLALPRSSNSDPGSQSGLSSPLPTTVRACFFHREKNSAFFSALVDSRRTYTVLPPIRAR